MFCLRVLVELREAVLLAPGGELRLELRAAGLGAPAEGAEPGRAPPGRRRALERRLPRGTSVF